MDTLPHCQICTQPFSVRVDQAEHSNFQLPAVLECGHIFCGRCLHLQAKEAKTLASQYGSPPTIMCNECKTEIPLLEETGKPFWRPNAYLVGLIVLQKLQSLDVSNIKWFPSYFNSVQLETKTDHNISKTVLCSECMRVKASCKCIKCEYSTCGPCFSKIHSASKMLRSHQAVPIYDSGLLSDESGFCSVHENKPLEYFCDDDQIAICSKCAIFGEHKGHNFEPIEDKNQKVLEDIDPILENAQKVLKLLKQSEKGLKKLTPQTQKDLADATRTIRKNFMEMHAILEKREHELLLNLANSCPGNVAVENMSCRISEEIKNLKDAINDAEQMTKSRSHHVIVNAHSILNKLKNVCETPCFLKTTKINDEIVCKFDSLNLQAEIEKFGIVIGGAGLRVELAKLNEIPDNLELDLSLDDTTDDRESVTTSSTNESVIDDLSDISLVDTDIVVSPRLQKEKLEIPERPNLPLLQHEIVYVTHIKSPNHFIVQRAAEINKLKTMSRNIQKYCSSTFASACAKFVPTPGEYVLGKFGEEGSWYRARVLSVDMKNNEDQAKLYYIDYGNQEIVPLKKIRTIPKRFMKLPELGLKCTLAGLLPIQNGDWDKEAILLFGRMCGDKPMVLYVYGKKDGLYEVDLSKPGLDDIDDDRPVSVRDTLVFLEYGCFATTVSGQNSIPKKPLRKFLLLPMLHQGESINGFITHVDSPSKLYIQQISEETAYFNNMMAELQKIYNKDMGDTWTIFNPIKGSICVSQFTDDNMWYRAVVIGLPGKRQVLVKYVDFGNTEQLPYWRLKKILDKFTVRPIQCLECTLAEIEPADKSLGWPPEAKKAIMEFLSRPLVIHVAAVTGSVLNVILYDVSSDDRVCLNALLVELGHAVRISADSQNTLQNVPQGNKSSFTNDLQTTTVNKMKLGKKLPKGTDCPDIEVQVSHVENPFSIFLQTLDDVNQDLNDLMLAMQQKSAERKSPKVKFSVWDHCAFLNSDNIWYRGRITAIEDKQYKVFAIDYGFTASVSHDQLGKLSEEELKPTAKALQCHLEGIQPAGDPLKWSITACEYLTHFITTHPCFMVPMSHKFDGGNAEQSLAIDLLIQKEIQGDALNPDKVEYKSITQQLLDEGLALPRRGPPKLPNPEHDLKVTLPPKPVNKNSYQGDKENSKDIHIVKGTLNDSLLNQKDTGIGNNADENDSLNDTHNVNYEGDKAATEDVNKVPGGFAPAIVPDETHLKVVPTYVDYDGIIYFHQLHDDESAEGRFGYVLKENSLEVILQNQYLESKGLYRGMIPRDGNCLFRAFAEALYEDQSKQSQLRLMAVEKLQLNWEQIRENFSLDKMAKSTYLRKMAQNFTYGGEPEIQTLALALNIHVTVYLGGLNFNIQKKEYGSTSTDCQTISLIYIADDEQVLGHYDIVVDSKERVDSIAEVYQLWRESRVKAMNEWDTEHHTYNYDESLLQQIMEQVQKHYENSQPDPDCNYQVGQAVIVKYSDDQFYRGIITDVTELGFKVLYIDFGNTETVPAELLRSQIILKSIPQQTLRCKLYGIKPNTEDGKWSVKTLELIHNTIVNQQCTLDVIEHLVPDLPLHGNLILSDGSSLADNLLSMEEAIKDDKDNAICSSTSSSSQTQPENLQEYEMLSLKSLVKNAVHYTNVVHNSTHNQVPSPFMTMELPEINQQLAVQITHVESPNQVYYQHVKQDGTSDWFLKIISDHLDMLAEYSIQLNQEALTYSTLKEIRPGTACCARYDQDGQWYRSLVIFTSECGIGVHFIDYGNTSLVQPECVRELPPEMLGLPTQAMACKIADLAPPEGADDWPKETKDKMSVLVANKVLCGVMVKDGPEMVFYDYSEVHANGGNLSELSPLYQNIVDMGLARL